MSYKDMSLEDLAKILRTEGDDLPSESLRELCECILHKKSQEDLAKGLIRPLEELLEEGLIEEYE